MQKNFWKKVATKTLLEHPRITVVEDDVILPTGTKTQYLRFEGLNSYVTVLAERGNSMALLKEYSYPHDEWLLQFTEGEIEAGEEPTGATIRELREEAGLAAQKIEQLGVIYDHHRRTTTKQYVMFTTGISEVTKTEGDEEEFGTELIWVDKSELHKLLLDGKIVQKNAAAALALYFAHKSDPGAN